MLALPRATVKQFPGDQRTRKTSKALRELAGKAATQILWIRLRRAGLGFVGLLARANEAFDGYRGFDPLPLFEFTYPIRNSIHHIASGFARSFAGGLCAAWLSVRALGALHNFYFFLRHTFSGKTDPTELELTKYLFESSVPDLTWFQGKATFRRCQSDFGCRKFKGGGLLAVSLLGHHIALPEPFLSPISQED